MGRGVKILIWVLVVLVILMAVFAFVFFGPPGVAEVVAEPEFCARCHVMEPQYQAWQQSQHDFMDTCNECHLPNDGFIEHWFWDGVVGVRDVVKWNLNLVPEHIEARERSKDWIQENCRRCHGEIMTDVHPPDDRWCWECHRESYHDITLRDERQNRNLFREDGE